MKLFENMKGMYSLSKTLRFELKPVGETLEKMQESGKNFVDKDKARAEEYKKLKTIIDEYHKYFINKSLEKLKFAEEDLKLDFGEKDKKILDKNKSILYKKVGECFDKDFLKNNVLGDGLFKAKGKQDGELIKFLKENNQLSEEKEKLISNFRNFTTYFSGFNENRSNIYSSEGKVGSVAYRIVDDNLPKFLKNCKIFEKIKNNTDILNSLSAEEKAIIKEEAFTSEYFNKCLTQNGIDKYNEVLGGYSKADGVKIQGINEKINLYNQQQKSGKIENMTMLYKQILNDRSTASFVFDILEDDSAVIEAIKTFSDEYYEIINKPNNILDAIDNLNENSNGIYLVNSLKLTNLSNAVFENWQYIEHRWKDKYVADFEWDKKKNITKADYKKQSDAYKAKKYFDLQEIFCILSIEDKEKLLSQLRIIKELKQKITSEYKNIKEYFNQPNLKDSENAVGAIKKLLDEYKNLQEAVSIFEVKDENIARNADFYNIFDKDYEVLKNIIPLYNKIRNYLTQKPYSDEKIKINFDNSTLLAGWDKNKEADNYCIILRKKDKDNIYNYYLAVLDKNSKNMFGDKEYSYNPNDYSYETIFYEKMVYKLIPDPVKQLPKCAFPKEKPKCLETMTDDKYTAVKQIYEKVKTEKADAKENKDTYEIDKKSLKILIDFYKEFCPKYWNHITEWNFKEEYKSLTDFYKDVDKVAYNLNFIDVAKRFVDENVKAGNLYLFQIWNKDFSKDSKGMPNLHTLYFKALFCEENLNKKTFKLCGGGEMFWRKKSIERKVTHPKNEPIEQKRNKQRKSVFEYDLIKDKRFTEDKFFLHVPITINMINERTENVNNKINDIIREPENKNEINIIGIDRGERHLLYVVLIDSSGKIKQQFSLNEIENKYDQKTNYHLLLDEREDKRNEARVSWGKIENIKEIKKGYLSQVVPLIVKLAIENNALIFLENLSGGFKNSRKKVEKQIYQNFEKALLDKLNYVVTKDKDESKILDGLQLANKFKSFEKLKGQSGIIFYIPAAYTSAVDPTTGYVDVVKPKYESIEFSKRLIEKFDSFKWNKNEQYFEIKIEYNKFSDKDFGEKTKWTVCTYGERVNTYPKKDNQIWTSEEIDLTDKLKKLFEKNSIAFENGNDIKTEILKSNSVEFFKELIILLRLTFKLRNSFTGKEEDYILSPVKNKEGKFFDSREQENSPTAELPVNADANGAYHIALKGLLAVKYIQENSKEKLSNENWFNFVTGRNK